MLGVGRTPLDDASFRQEMASALPRFAAHLPAEAAAFVPLLHYQSIDTGDPAAYEQVKQRVYGLCAELGIPHNCLFYLSTPPDLYPKISACLAASDLNTSGDGWKRLVVEKPFGRDLASARELNRQLLAEWREDQLYRIDHYLGKETVQNLLVFRFANEIFDSLWNHRYVDYVEITSAESLGVERRAGYFDGSGIVRDMVQNHLLQVLAMVAIDPPGNFDATSVRYETLKVFQSLRTLQDADLARSVVLGQYAASSVRGQEMAAYRAEPGIPAGSRADTFAAMRLFLDHHRWFDVPFYLRVGKRLPTRVTEVVVHFRKTPHPAFGVRGGAEAQQNHLIIRIQPDEGILLQFGLKEPGAGFHVKPVSMDFHYSDLADTRVPESYERLLLDCMSGDATLYAMGEAVEKCWSFIDPVIAWRESGEAPLFGYPAGSWGPREADALIEADGHFWRYPCQNLASGGEYCEL
ncbi:MAG: Glucose-6-phosphate 1-dehydrogenase [Candidatus Accumulibacter phosphatis]|uniref:Glucose-6-phosphate 1-dehydrogenase n=1 Tax=Candidatus Accumulibacter phosphatis TaxID=327160 RepID=A0A080M0U5_9PROT|nr:MAG: Glucose-6-phosphate 1-dehydrogenase [Candidatus Accumulibacter phosphatis]